MLTDKERIKEQDEIIYMLMDELKMLYGVIGNLGKEHARHKQQINEITQTYIDFVLNNPANNGKSAL